MSIGALVNLLFNNPPARNNHPAGCKECWDMPGLDINCGGQIEPCRYCNGTGMQHRQQPNTDWASLDHSFGDIR